MKLRSSASKHVSLNSQSRRMFLRSAGGLALSLPFMPSLLSSGAAQAAASKPLRYVTFFTSYGGLQHRNWGGTNLPQTPFQLYSNHTARVAPLSSLTQNGALSSVLGSNYQTLWGSMNLIMGSDQPYYIGHNRGVGLGGFVRSYPGQAVITDQGDFATERGLAEEIPTLDQTIGFAGGNGIYGLGLGGRRRFLNISTSWTSSSWGRDDFFSKDHIGPRDLMNTPSGIFSYLFGSVQSPNSPNPLLNLVNEFWPSGRELIKRLSGDDKDSVERLFSLAQDAANDYSLPGPDTRGINPPSGNLDQDGPARLNMLADIIALAFKSDVTRIVNVHSDMVVNGYDFHAVSHAPSNADRDAGQSQMVEIHQNLSNNFFARLGANLLQQDPFDPSSTILRNSLCYWTKENKVAHDMMTLPTLLMGEAGGRLQTGNFIDLRDLTRNVGTDATGDRIYPGDLQNRLWASILYAMNIPRATYEFARGGTPNTVSLEKGYGQVLRLPARTFYSIADYHHEKIGEPYEFLTKAGVQWG